MTPEQLERSLRQPGTRESGAGRVPMATNLAEARAVLRRIERGRMLRTVTAGAGGIAALAATAAIAVALVQVPRPQVSNPPTGSAASTPAVTPVCRPGDLHADADRWGAAAGSRGTTVTLTNVGSITCTLTGSPGAEIRDAMNASLVTTGDRSVRPHEFGAQVVRLEPGGQAVTTIVWSNWCGTAPARPLSVTLRLPTGDLSVQPDVAAPEVLVPPCMGTDPSSLSTIAFEAP